MRHWWKQIGLRLRIPSAPSNKPPAVAPMMFLFINTGLIGLMKTAKCPASHVLTLSPGQTAPEDTKNHIDTPRNTWHVLCSLNDQVTKNSVTCPAHSTATCTFTYFYGLRVRQLLNSWANIPFPYPNVWWVAKMDYSFSWLHPHDGPRSTRISCWHCNVARQLNMSEPSMWAPITGPTFNPKATGLKCIFRAHTLQTELFSQSWIQYPVISLSR